MLQGWSSATSFDAVVDQGKLQRMDEALSPPQSQLEASRVTEKDTWELSLFSELYPWAAGKGKAV